MNRPYIICHMLQSIDGKVTGDFLGGCPEATERYYEINRRYAADAFACGRITMEGSFTGGWYPDLTAYPAAPLTDHVADCTIGFYAVAFDRRGRLGWQTPCIVDDDPGYGGAHIIEVLTEAVDPQYLGYLRQVGVSYVFAGKEEMDVSLALRKLHELFGIRTLLLEGGSVLDGAFQHEGFVDELSLVTVPVIAGGADKPLFMDSVMHRFTLTECVTHDNGVIWTNYKTAR